MNYHVVIRRNDTGEERTIDMKTNWEDWHWYWWAEGNFSDDYNRAVVFYGDEDFEYAEPESDRESAFTVLRAVLADGTVHDIKEYEDYIHGRTGK